ncbi:MAG: GNAT family N-acetyltransferase [Nitrososphaerales archaeon]|jgi:ribosomal protein S18 acetylase RimI-like enzyme
MPVRKVAADDLHKLSVFILEAWREAGPGALGFAGATDEVILELASEQTLKAMLVNPVLQIFVAEDAGEIVGFSSLKRVDSGTVELSGIVVLQNLVGRGLGTELLELARESATKEGYLKMVVKTEVINDRAVAFYKKLGFFEAAKITEDVEGTEVRLMILERSLP